MKNARDEKLLSRYLLGQTTEDESSRIEDGYFRSPEHYEEILAIEEELIFRYVREDLTPLERLQFEERFLASDRRRLKYELTRDLAAYVAESYYPVPEASATARTPWFFNLLAIANWRLAGVVAMLFAMTTLIFVLVWNRHPSAGQLAGITEPVPPAPSPLQLPDVALTQPNAPAALKAPAPSTIPVNPPKQIPVVQVDLSTDRPVVEHVKTVLIPTGVATLQMRLPLEDLTLPECVVVIKKVDDGDVIWRGEGLSPVRSKTGRTLVFRVPTRLFESRDYVISVHDPANQGEMRLQGESFFSIQRP
jgi:hypothetical protein